MGLMSLDDDDGASAYLWPSVLNLHPSLVRYTRSEIVKLSHDVEPDQARRKLILRGIGRGGVLISVAIFITLEELRYRLLPGFPPCVTFFGSVIFLFP